MSEVELCEQCEEHPQSPNNDIAFCACCYEQQQASTFTYTEHTDVVSKLQGEINDLGCDNAELHIENNELKARIQELEEIQESLYEQIRDMNHTTALTLKNKL